MGCGPAGPLAFSHRFAMPKCKALIEPRFDPTGSGCLLPFPFRAPNTSCHSVKMAGVVGFEPTNAEIKTQCLAAWRHPSKSLRLSECGMQWRVVYTLRDKPAHVCRALLQNTGCCTLAVETREHTGTGAGESRGGKLIQPNQGLINFWIQRSDQFLAAVSSGPLKKGRYFDG